MAVYRETREIKMKLKNEQEIEALANQLMKHLAPNCYTGHGLSRFELEDAKSAILFIQQYLLSQASEGFEEYCIHKIIRGTHKHERVFNAFTGNYLNLNDCELLWQSAKLSQAKSTQCDGFIENSRLQGHINKKLQKENEELRKDLIILCRELLGGAGDVYLQTLANQYQVRWSKGETK